MLRKMRRMLRRISGPLTVVVWQAAPVSTFQDESGRTRLTLGWGRATFIDRMYEGGGCTGEPRRLVGEQRVSGTVAGAQLEHWPSPTWRLTAWTTNVAGNRDGMTGLAGGLAVGWEKSGVGLGFGFAVSPFEVPLEGYDGMQTVWPSLSVRLGGLDGLHVLADIMPPGPVSLLTGHSRIAIGMNRGRKPGFSALAGFSNCVFCDASDDESATALFGEFAFSLGHRFDLFAYGLAGEKDVRALGAGLRTRF